MRYAKVLESGDELKLTTGFAGKFKVFWNGLKVERTGGSYHVNMNNESRQLVINRHKFTGDPIVLLDGEEIEIARKLKGYEWAFSFLPLFLLFIGGALGGLSGAIGFTVNVMLFRSKLLTAVKMILSVLILVAAVFMYFALGSLFYYIFSNV